MTQWRPLAIRRFIQSLGTSTQVLRVETDTGEGFLKALGNPEGPHALASEWVGTRLASMLGLPTLQHAIIEVTGDVDLPFHGGGSALPGSAFITLAEAGLSWGGDAKALRRIVNPADVASLVVLDTWIRNRDRYSINEDGRIRSNYDNVWLSREGMSGRKLLLKAIDHTHCFGSGGTLTTRLAHLDCVRDEAIYGLFPQFRDVITEAAFRAACARLRGIRPTQIEAAVRSVPQAWEVPAEVRTAWIEMIVQRGRFVADTLLGRIFRQGSLGI